MPIPLLVRDRARLPEQAQPVHRAPSLDDLAVFKSIDGNSADRNFLPLVRNGGGPAGGNLVAFGQLILDFDPEIGTNAPARLYGLLHAGQPGAAVGIVGVVVDDVRRYIVIKAMKVACTPDFE